LPKGLPNSYLGQPYLRQQKCFDGISHSNEYFMLSVKMTLVRIYTTNDRFQYTTDEQINTENKR
jgi:hypothetical protein